MLDIETYLSNELVKCNCSEFHINQLIETIHPLLIKPRLLDNQKLACWLAEKNISMKSNPVAFLKKALVEELNNGVFDKVEHHCCIHPLLETLKDNGIEVKEYASTYISTMFDYLYNNDYLNQEELIEFNRKAISYLANKKKTTDDFIALWQNSKISKERKFDWNTINRLAEQNKQRWIETIKELEK